MQYSAMWHQEHNGIKGQSICNSLANGYTLCEEHGTLPMYMYMYNRSSDNRQTLLTIEHLIELSRWCTFNEIGHNPDL